jgi:hypothetical protein
MDQRFPYYGPMTLPCRPGTLILCLAVSLLGACASPEQQARRSWEKEVGSILTERRENFQACGRHLTRPTKERPVTINMTFRVNPAGALETLWLDESGQWDQRFYDCVFNVVDGMRFPAVDDQTALEVSQTVVFRGRG